MPPGVRNDAVGAAVVTAVLHLQERPGPAGQASGRQDLEAVQGRVGLRRDGAAVRYGVFQPGHEVRPAAGAPDEVRSQVPGVRPPGLGIAAAHGHHGLRPLPPDTANHLPGLPVTLRRDGTGVDHVGVRFFREGHHAVAPLPQELFHGLRLVLVDFTAQGIDCRSHKPLLVKSGNCFRPREGGKDK